MHRYEVKAWQLKILTGSSHYPLFDRISKNLQKEHLDCVVPLSATKFSNDNIKVKIEDCVRGQDVFIIQPNYPDQNERLMELLIIINALKHASAGRITAVLPYFPYSRSDKKDEARISITARLVADMLETAGAHRVITMNLHSPQVQGFFRIPVDHLLPARTIRAYLKNKIKKDLVLVAPDTGSSKMVAGYAEYFGTPVAYMNKIRVDDSESPTITNVAGCVKEKDCLIIDDEIASGNSVIKAAEKLKELGASSVEVCAIHGVMTKDAPHKISESNIDRVYVTDTVYRDYVDKEINLLGKVETISMADMFSDAIECVHHQNSMSQIFDRH